MMERFEQGREAFALSDKMISFAQNGEDVVLARALADVEVGVYIDIGANDPSFLSVTKSFYDRGWSGVCVEPNPRLVEKFRAERPRDAVLQAVISDSPRDSLTFHMIGDTGLSTLVDGVALEHARNGWAVEDVTVEPLDAAEALARAGFPTTPIHFAVIDTEGAELQVLRSFDFDLIRPWILVVEATAPMSTIQVHDAWEDIVLGAGYVFCLFDGLSRFYVDGRNHPELVDRLSYPAGVFDEYVTIDDKVRDERVRDMERAFAVHESETNKLRSTIQVRDQRIAGLEQRLDEMVRTVSWRVTAPLRSLRRFERRQR